jgi:tetratricopeptide (TPR) repeat protein
MQGMKTQLLRRSKAGKPAGVAILAAMLSVLAGCAVGERVKPHPAEQKPGVANQSPVAEGPSVARLEGGREGFVITETPQIGAETRGDFESAVAMMNGKNYEKAIGLLEKVIEQSPGVTAPYIDIAMAYEHVEKLEEAEQNLKTALSLVPDHPVASNEYGLLLRRTGRFAEARTIYEKTLTTFPEYLPARRNLGILCDLYLNDPACALEQYEIYSKAMPKDEQVKIWIADLRLRTGHQ